MEKADVLVVLVTYNRKECLKVVLDAIENQTIKVRGILIVDNCSTDGTNNYLIERGFTTQQEYGIVSEKDSENGIRQIYYRNLENVGGAGGFAKAIEIVQNYESNYIWIMDDDVQPEPDCLEKMLGVMDDNIKACIPNRTDAYFQDHACLDIDLHSLRKFGITSRKCFAPIPFEEEVYSVKDMAFEGPLVATEIIRQIGLPEKGFFIEYDDTDYASRILQYSEILFVTQACLHRQLAKNSVANQVKSRKYNWRNYYSIRNNILFNHKHCKTWRAKHLSTGLIWAKHVLRSLYHGHPENIKIINKAVMDGIQDKYGKTINPGDL